LKELGAEMSFIPDFDVDDVLRTLDYASKNYQAGSKEEKTIQLAAISLLYVLHIGKMRDFRMYYQGFFEPSQPVKVSHALATQEEADAWLSGVTATDGELVSIAGRGFLVIQLPKGLKFLRMPLPKELGNP
jgi:hypothetical protein